MSFKSNRYGSRESYNKRRKRYREDTGSGLYVQRLYTEEEDRLIMSHEIPDRELSVKIERSVTAIQSRRARLKESLWTIKD